MYDFAATLTCNHPLFVWLFVYSCPVPKTNHFQPAEADRRCDVTYWTTFVAEHVAHGNSKGRVRLDYDDLEQEKIEKSKIKINFLISCMRMIRVYCCILYCLRPSSLVASQRGLSLQWGTVELTV